MNSITDSSPGRKILIRLLVVLIGVSPIILLEAALRLAGIGAVGSTSDPLSGFNRNIPLFERQGPVYRTSRAREPFFPTQQFREEKPTKSFRVFCFGGSTVHGHPYESETAFPKWVELELATADPTRVYEVVNCGGISYASYRLAPLVKEVIRYHPDLIVVATGENEFLEDRTYQSLKERSRLRTWIEDAVQSFRIVTIGRAWLRGSGRVNWSSEPARKEAGADVRTRLDDRSGYASYHRDEAWHDRVALQFEESLQQMVNTCGKANVPLILVKLGSNLRDCPPYKSEHRRDLSPEAEQKWQELFDAAAVMNDAADALATYRKAERIDAEYALLSFRIARLLDAQGQTKSALTYYTRARDQDVCPLRLIGRHAEILKHVSEATKTPLLDAAAIIAERSMEQIPGADWYLDHVHPNIGGHQLMAKALVAEIQQLGIIPSLQTLSDQQRREMYRVWIEKLDPRYPAEGLRRVEWLEHWARRERLLHESEPQDGPGFLRAGFRHLELGQERQAWSDFETALKMDKQLATDLKKHVELLISEGMVRPADKLDKWCKERDI